ncbi:MAG: YicC family protein [Oscillospiraceae bacterium]|nr:YicC family protein [Oscillospiraceae bacterium]
MIRSMTGYGRAELVIDHMSVSVEVKSVNHRFFEFSVRLPKIYSFLEDRLKNLFQSKVSRGKIDAFLNIDVAEIVNTKIAINHSYAKGYVDALKELSKVYDIKDDISVSTIARNNDVFIITKELIDEDLVWNAVLQVANSAIDAIIVMRENEGTRLVNDVKSRIEEVLKCVAFVETKSPETVKAYREKIEQKVRELIGDVHVDEQRLITETAIFADKVSVCEETVRLRSHMEQLVELLDSGDAVGRKLDFIVQEMNREANTIGSKCQDIEVSRAVVDIKSEIEKIREQIQNIE